jgi:formylglycine-generating enzyme required for sulfatase activity
MMLRSSAVFAMALIVMAEATPRIVARQAAKTVDQKEMAAVERIRARIEEQLKKNPAASPAAYKVTIPNTTVTYGMAPVPAGEFQMGSAAAGAPADERPQHKVRLDAFWMQTHEVPWDSYLMFMFADQAHESAKPDALVDALSRPTAPHLEMSFGRGNAGFPAISMTQHAANKYAEWLSAKTGEYYRLPTEAEWEYACRAGTTGPFATGENITTDQANYNGRFPYSTFAAGVFRQRPTPVGSFPSNRWGLADMHGNVWEWTSDSYGPYPEGDTANIDPHRRDSPSADEKRVIRGGSWYFDGNSARCALRYTHAPKDRGFSLGFRLAADRR